MRRCMAYGGTGAEDTLRTSKTPLSGELPNLVMLRLRDLLSLDRRHSIVLKLRGYGTPSITRQSHTTAMHQTDEMVAHTLDVFSYLRGDRSLPGWIGANCQEALGEVCLGRTSEDAYRSWGTPRSM
ncbi:hypothetical protein NXS19_000968 [Fusarium pseudograminearum]|nr:hypothetical protein NXS19_000968 [Fusarium pseudograminearum]